MSKRVARKTVALRIDAELKTKLELLAKLSGVSLTDCINVVLAMRVIEMREVKP